VAEKQIPDLILLDVMMPDMNGFEVCKILKANPKTQEIEIIFVTAAITHEDELKGLSLGAVDYIHKPFSIAIVQAKVALHLERAYTRKLRADIEQITHHDLKTPLGAILCYPEMMLLDGGLSSEHQEYLEEIIKAGKEMLQMINSSLDLFKMETGCYQYNPDTVDLSVVINSVMADLKPLLNTYGATIHLSHQSSPQQPEKTPTFMALAEKNLSYSLFANLIRNAIEACTRKDTVQIVLSYEKNDCVISITNPGSIPEQIRHSFFEKYVTAGKKQGTGLGTYSAKLMTQTQSGSIAMCCNEREICITVKLPAANQRCSDDEQ
jgi:signal transduction histidine kinase